MSEVRQRCTKRLSDLDIEILKRLLTISAGLETISDEQLSTITSILFGMCWSRELDDTAKELAKRVDQEIELYSNAVCLGGVLPKLAEQPATPSQEEVGESIRFVCISNYKQSQGTGLVSDNLKWQGGKLYLEMQDSLGLPTWKEQDVETWTEGHEESEYFYHKPEKEER